MHLRDKVTLLCLAWVALAGIVLAFMRGALRGAAPQPEDDKEFGGLR